MIILLASASGTVLTRWQGLLAEGNEIVQVRTLDELRRTVPSARPDLVMLHRDLVDQAECAALRAASPASRLFLLSDRPEPDEGLAFLKVGIVGYANTYISAERLKEALNVIDGGGVWLGQQVIQQLILEAAQNAAAGRERRLDELLAPLSPMERKVAELIAGGRTNLEIAAELGIVERTVKAHLTSVYGKLPAGNRLSLALLINRG
ncbi:helix-turn-helix transcriptional regulator [Geomonas edaphica]|uniref:helix-turn-helix transcriptional regulator n=1 Tax=Geomonas edaphica TaxID=2570226 RepID=UPI0010A81B39|nr:LuxR C-terminal-related transcriptional regulator [Geomonas edaphica]